MENTTNTIIENVPVKEIAEEAVEMAAKTTSKWKTGGLIVGGIVLIGATGYFTYKGIKHYKKNHSVTLYTTGEDKENIVEGEVVKEDETSEEKDSE